MKHWSKRPSATLTTVAPETLYYHRRPVSADVEMSSYALMAHLHMHSAAAEQSQGVSAGLPIVRWLSAQRNAQGGFSSTQVCVLVLNVLGCWERVLVTFILVCECL